MFLNFYSVFRTVLEYKDSKIKYNIVTGLEELLSNRIS